MLDTSENKARALLGYVSRLPLIAYLRDPLHGNAIFLIATSAANALIGFFFWTLAARLYPVEAVGQATAMVSAGNLLVILSGLGMSIGVIRFLGESRNKVMLINSAFTVVAAAALFLAIVFLIGLDIWSPALDFVQQSPWLIAAFICYCLFQTMGTLQNNIFAAFRKSYYAFFQSLIVAVKILLLVLLLGLGLVGIFSSFTLGVILAFLAANFFLRRLHSGYRLQPALERNILKAIFKFTSGNYVGDVLKALTGVIMPLVVINLLGAEQNAYFYIAWMIASLYFTVAYSVNLSLVAEATHQPENLYHQVSKVLKFAFMILVPAIVLIYFLGGFLLSFFGEQYANEGLWLLRLLTISSIPVTVNETYIAIFRIRKQVLPIMLIYGLISLATILGGYLLLGVLGLNGIGVAWLASHVLTMIVVILLNWRHMVHRVKHV